VIKETIQFYFFFQFIFEETFERFTNSRTDRAKWVGAPSRWNQIAWKFWPVFDQYFELQGESHFGIWLHICWLIIMPIHMLTFWGYRVLRFINLVWIFIVPISAIIFINISTKFLQKINSIPSRFTRCRSYLKIVGTNFEKIMQKVNEENLHFYFENNFFGWSDIRIFWTNILLTFYYYVIKQLCVWISIDFQRKIAKQLEITLGFVTVIGLIFGF